MSEVQEVTETIVESSGWREVQDTSGEYTFRINDLDNGNRMLAECRSRNSLIMAWGGVRVGEKAVPIPNDRLLSFHTLYITRDFYCVGVNDEGVHVVDVNSIVTPAAILFINHIFQKNGLRTPIKQDIRWIDPTYMVEVQGERVLAKPLNGTIDEQAVVVTALYFDTIGNGTVWGKLDWRSQLNGYSRRVVTGRFSMTGSTSNWVVIDVDGSSSQFQRKVEELRALATRRMRGREP